MVFSIRIRDLCIVLDVIVGNIDTRAAFALVNINGESGVPSRFAFDELVLVRHGLVENGIVEINRGGSCKSDGYEGHNSGDSDGELHGCRCNGGIDPSSRVAGQGMEDFD